MMKINKNMEWCRPFLNSAKDLIDFEQIAHVRGYIVPFNKIPRQEASITKLKNGKFIIAIRLNRAKGDRKTHYSRIFLPDVLDSIAHELSHATNWEHDASHMKLQYRIMQRFSNVVQKIQDKENVGDYYNLKYWRIK